MPQTIYQHFNRGEIDDLAVGRDDVERVNNSSSLMENFLPRRLGPMSTRPGWEVKGEADEDGYLYPFIRNINSKFKLDFHRNAINRVAIYKDGEPVMTAASSTIIANSNFNTDLSSWNVDAGGGTVQWVTGSYAEITSDGVVDAELWQTTTTDLGVDQTIRISTLDGRCKIKLGTSGQGSTDILDTEVGPGEHFFTVLAPSADITVTLASIEEYPIRVDYVTFDAASYPVILPLPYTGNDLDFSQFRCSQSFDVLFGCGDGKFLFTVSYYGERSWSVSTTLVDDGPFGEVNVTPVTLDPLSDKGEVTIDVGGTNPFKSNDTDRLVKIVSEGQNVEETVTGVATGYASSVKLTGADSDRVISIVRSGDIKVANPVKLQRSTDNATWTTVKTYTSVGTSNYNDGVDNAIYYYRLEIDVTIAAEVVTASITSAQGSTTGVGRITAVGATAITVQALEPFIVSTPTVNWYISEWGGSNGWPVANKHYEGRLWYTGFGFIWGSKSDEFNSFSGGVDDADSIRRLITVPSSGFPRWLGVTSRLTIGTDTDDIVARSTSFDEIMTPTNINLKDGSSQGAAPVDVVRSDGQIFYTQRSEKRLMVMDHDGNSDTPNTTDLNTLNNDIITGSIIRLAMTKQPETRIWAVLDDGNMAVLTVDAAEEVQCWSRLTIPEYEIKDVVSLPGIQEDEVFIRAARGGRTRLYQLALTTEAELKPVDAFYYSEASAGPTLTDVTNEYGWVDGDEMTIYVDGVYTGTATVSGTTLNIGGTYSKVGVGHSFESKYKSNKISDFVDYSVLTNYTRVARVGMVGRRIDYDRFTYGPSFDELQDLPDKYKGKTLAPNTVLEEYDNRSIGFKGKIDTDSRVCIKTTGPATIMVLSFEMSESSSRN